jgi:carbon-monoxide dehydrogenase medium subunit
MLNATTTMGSVQLREGASVGGNICTASPAGDTGPPLLCYDAMMVVESARGEREVPAESFFVGPGKTALARDELLVGVKLPWPHHDAVGIYLKGARRAAVDLALVSVAIVAWPAPENTSGVELRMGLGAVAPTPIRALEAEKIVREHGLDNDHRSARSQKLVEAVRAAARPIDDIRSTAAYRLELVGQLAARGASMVERELQGHSRGSTEINT